MWGHRGANTKHPPFRTRGAPPARTRQRGHARSAARGAARAASSMTLAAAGARSFRSPEEGLLRIAGAIDGRLVRPNSRSHVFSRTWQTFAAPRHTAAQRHCRYHSALVCGLLASSLFILAAMVGRCVCAADAPPASVDGGELVGALDSIEEAVYKRDERDATRGNGGDGGEDQARQTCRWLGFVHIPKTGGTSVLNAVRSSPLVSSHTVYLKRLNHLPAVTQALRMSEAAAANTKRHSSMFATTASWDSARTLTFATVRNPFAWAVSQYEFGMRTHCEREDDTAKQRAKFPACAFAERPKPPTAKDGKDAGDLRKETDASSPIQATRLLREHFAEWLRVHDHRANVTGRHPNSVGSSRFMQPNVIAVAKMPCDNVGATEPLDSTQRGGTSQLYWLTTCGEKRWAVKVRRRRKK